MSEKATVGFVGIGTMGLPMATNLAGAGFPVIAFDSDPRALARLSAVEGVTAADSLADLAARSDAVITMLPDGKVVRRVVLGEPDGKNDCLVAGLRKGAAVLDMSSSDPLGTRDLGKALADRDLRLLDAPVSGGVKGAAEATLAIMAGGDAAIFAEFKPVLATMGRVVHHAGPLGAGHAVKALNNYVSAAGLTAALEAMVTAHRFGVDPGVTIDIINTSSGRNNSTETKIHQQVLNRSFQQGFALGLMAKDVRTARDLATGMGLDVPMAERTADMWDRAEQALGGSADHTEMLRYIEQASGESLDDGA